MPEFNVACTRSCLLSRVNFVGRPHLTGKPKTEAFRASGGVKASRIQVNLKASKSLILVYSTFSATPREAGFSELFAYIL
jgi:hypothetical protein